MTREEAIEIIQDMMNVVQTVGSAYVYKHNGGYERLRGILDILRSVSREQVDKLWRGEWEWFDEEIGTFLDGYEREWGWRCGKCSHVLPDEYDDPDLTPKLLFCPNCGAPMTDEAVEMVMDRLEAVFQ